MFDFQRFPSMISYSFKYSVAKSQKSYISSTFVLAYLLI